MLDIKILIERWRRDLPVLLLVNTLIAGLCTLVSDIRYLLDNLLISHSIGFSISLLNTLIFCQTSDPIVAPSKLRPWRFILVIPFGVLLGFKIANWLGAPDLLAYFWVNPSQQWRGIATAILLTASATGFFIVFYRAQTYRAQLAIEQQQSAEAKQSELAAQLALLQAQIEPHFLFNTLANVRSLITRDAPLAQAMLDHLNNYLRASLSRTRKRQVTLAEELDLVTALLAISQIRLGSRLRYQIDVPADLHAALLPPLLLQPLVENALEHGIEPAVEGGEVRIVADVAEQLLRLRVYDTGLGLDAGVIQESGDGVGLPNVRKRLENLYGGEGRLALYPNLPSGVISEIVLPLNRLNH
ncbi:histidine kinase [Iodobacter sp. CM08]|uniref:sensor histidine kinase n=1 Tax=Iodobacter sp. CM08 TaxID=3085902 RepID=UPI002982B3B7|nr:histidine kinase [Iodobacter sp. CM08]MDW5418500.1 histidine kinase [Iodobacter sp. CM08]